MKVGTESKESKPFKLIPGIMVDDNLLDECVVRLVTRRDLKHIESEKNNPKKKHLTDAEDLHLMYCISRIGDETDKTMISLFIEHMTDTAIAQIQLEYRKLQESCFETGETEEPKFRKIVRETDIVSKPFELNPGIEINGITQRSAIVRLIRRGEYKHIIDEQDPVKRGDLELFYSVVQFGDCTSFKIEDLDNLVEVDQERIFKAAEGLRAEYASSTKSTEGQENAEG